MERVPHENAATVLVDPRVLRDLEVHLMSLDLRLWPVATAPICTDGPRTAFQIRRRMLTARRGEWDDAADWEPSGSRSERAGGRAPSRCRGPRTRRSTARLSGTPSTCATAAASAGSRAWTCPVSSWADTT